MGIKSEDSTLTSGGAGAAPSAADILLKLAERCEREKPTFALDCEIMRTVEPDTFVDRGQYRRGLGPWRTVPKFTTSLDAAVTLVPEGAGWNVQGNARSPYYAMVGGRPGNRTMTPALALCAAALRARAALLTDGATPAPSQGQAVQNLTDPASPSPKEER